MRDHFKVQSLEGFGCEEMKCAESAAGAILHYIKQQLRRQTNHITRLATYRDSGFVILDAATQANLELTVSRGAKDTSLLGALDRTVTPMGGRKLRDWILHPLRELAPIVQRQHLIAGFLAEPFLFEHKCRESLEIDPRYRAHRGPCQPGWRQCPRPRCPAEFCWNKSRN